MNKINTKLVRFRKKYIWNQIKNNIMIRYDNISIEYIGYITVNRLYTKHNKY